jgi:SAM-dependent methyltransferase
MSREPRLVFGEVAERYDRVRPSYPEDLVDDVIALSGAGGNRRALEVGAGTGKATVMFAGRGVAVVAVEPSREMTAIARRRCVEFPDVTIDESDFEDWRPDGQQFALVFSAQAWHWVAPALRYVRAREALSDGGLLAVFWNRPDWDRCALRDELRTVYRRYAPDFGPDPGPMHPGSEIAPDRWEDWDAEIATARGFGEPQIRLYRWTAQYSARRYMELLATSQDHILLGDETRAALLDAVGEAIERAGGSLFLPLVTKLCLARAAGSHNP